MKYKKSIIVVLLAIFLFSITSVCASEIDTPIASEDTSQMELSDSNKNIEDNSQTSEEKLELSVDDERLSAQTDTNVLGDSPATYSDLAREINAPGTVILKNKSYTYDDDAPAITISEDNKVIDGNGAIIDMTGSTIRAFTVSASGVTIKNLTIKNANYNWNGGAIYFSSSGNVTNCNFTKNSAFYGGAVYFEGIGTVSNCSFTDNSAKYGGAVCFQGTGTVTNCSFTKNFASERNGAVYFISEGTVENCTFTNNSATECGAVRFIGEGTVKNCSFTDNSAGGLGGAVFSESTCTVSNCSFTANSASYGGALYFCRTGTVSNCSFTANSASYGGAVFSESTVTVSNCSFTANSAGKYGGAVYFVSAVTVSNCSFTDNSAGGLGGAVYFDSTGTVTNCSFTDNSVDKNNENSKGGAIYFYDDESYVFDSIFVNNSAANYGAVHLSSVKGAVTGCIFVNNSANKGIVGQAFDSPGDIIINYNIFLNNDVSGIIIDFAATEAIDVNFNWFGSNATDYTKNPGLKFGDVWLFLNATANPNTLRVSDTSNITFSLYEFNSSSNKIHELNNTLLYPVNLTVTTTNGDVRNTTGLGETITYVAAALGTGKVTASIENAAYTIELKILKQDPGLTVGPQEIYYGSNALIAINYNSIATGKVNITLTGKKGTFNYQNLDLNATIVLPKDIPADEYNVTVSYSGDENFMNATANATLTINKANSKLTINDNVTFDYNTNGSTTVSFTNATGVNASVVGQPDAIVVVNDTTITVSGLNAGNYILTVTTITDANHNNVTKNATITVNKLQTQLTGNAITTTYNIDKDLVITLKDANGNALGGVGVTVDLNGAKTYVTDANGQIKISTKGLAPKAYTAKITFNGNTVYAESSKDVKVTVKKATPKLTAKKKTFKSSVKTKKYTIVLKDNTGKAIKKAKVTLKVKGKTYKATTNSKGKATFKIKKLNKKGTFKAKITYKGSRYYNKVSKKAKIKVIVTFKTVSKGSKDKSTVKEIQQALKDHGYYLSYKGHYLKVDGKFKGCTERSVKEFQKDKHLKVTGKVDEKTAKKLGLI